MTAYLKLCPACKMHGKIVFPDGSESGTFVTYEDSIEVLRIAHLEGKLTHEECCMLRDQIKSSSIIKLVDLREEFLKTLRRETEFFKFIQEKFQECDEEEIDFRLN